MHQTGKRSYHHRHLDFVFSDAPDGTRRLSVHSAEVLRGVLGGDLAATGYKTIGTACLTQEVAVALELALRDLRTDLSGAAPCADGDADDGGGGDWRDVPLAAARRQRRQQLAERLEAFFARHRGNPLVANGVVIDPRSARGRQLVAQIRAGQAEPRLLADWVRLRIEWRQIIDAA